jgi:hypothetical protein
VILIIPAPYGNDKLYFQIMRHIGILFAVSFLFIPLNKIMGDSRAIHNDMLPDSINGWKAKPQKNITTRDGLYEYIDGGAELYISFGFKKLTVREYHKKGQPAIKADIFNMGNSKNAFGVFGYSQETVENDFGQGSQSSDGLILFWKDKYYVSLLCFPQTPESKETAISLAKRIEASIKESGPLPQITALLPAKGLVRESVRYFYHYIWLNSFYFISDSNVFNINDNTEAVLAKYGEKNKRNVLLIIKYNEESDSEKALQSFIKQVEPGLASRDAVKNDKGKWTACTRKGKYLIGVFNGNTREETFDLVKSIPLP